ncbi:hypothetical protein ATO10_10195 [Actibacterium atlanticum]|uniref:Uncharacterized protein n=1 Tax=Actibacterium atlanticum TaxID=1461693 RepID=A0A058ZJI6_9RHOB|nr:hypothetical protein [Actibacterium atlanticum]KCV81708.1 hypothetical protein ATO10_10195 [Actibacterium atlanticum]
MEVLIWGGAAVSVIGLIGLMRCIWLAYAAKKAGLPDDEMKAKLQKVVVLNMGALFVSAIGLMMVVAGVMLA